MTAQRSLRRMLARQWMAFSLVLFAGFAAMAVVLLYMLEDSFIDQRLREVAGTVASLASPPTPPEGFRVYAVDAAPSELRERMRGVRPGAIQEFWLPDRHYVHVLAGRAGDGGEFLLRYDVTDQLRVNAGIARGLPLLLLMAAGLALCAYSLARLFVARVSIQALALVEQVDAGSDPERLRALARDGVILEFCELARHIAEAWETRLASLARERETLAYLGHELRTPLQSARTSLALLQEDRANAAAWPRLERALERLTRASHSILWLASEGVSTVRESNPVGPVLDGLVEEFAPLAATRQQTIVCQGAMDRAWPLPQEVAETVLANLMLNAIQHGGAGVIEIEASGDGLRLSNPAPVHVTPGGFGLGLEVVQRLLNRFGWALSHSEASGRVILTIAPK